MPGRLPQAGQPTAAWEQRQWTSLTGYREHGSALPKRRRVSLQPTAAPRTCTSKRLRRWIAWGAVTLRKRLGSEPKPTTGQPVRKASRAATGRTFLDTALGTGMSRAPQWDIWSGHDRRTWPAQPVR